MERSHYIEICKSLNQCYFITSQMVFYVSIVFSHSVEWWYWRCIKEYLYLFSFYSSSSLLGQWSRISTRTSILSTYYPKTIRKDRGSWRKAKNKTLCIPNCNLESYGTSRLFTVCTYVSYLQYTNYTRLDNHILFRNTTRYCECTKCSWQV